MTMPNQRPGTPDHAKLVAGDMRMAANKQRYGQTDLDSKMEAAREAGGGIKPMSHQELAGPTPLDKVMGWANRVLKGGKR